MEETKKIPIKRRVDFNIWWILDDEELVKTKLLQNLYQKIRFEGIKSLSNINFLKATLPPLTFLDKKGNSLRSNAYIVLD